MRLNNTFAIAGAFLALGTIFVIGCNAAKTDAATTNDPPATTGDKPTDEPMKDMSPEEHSKMDMGETVAYTNEKGELVCPVQGDVIESPEKAAGFQDYKGKRYYFCCAGCPEAFAADPEKYAK